VPDKKISLSVIIPTYNRAETLERCLEALARQTTPVNNFQVIVADDGSEDDTRERVKRFEKGVFTHIHYLWQPNSGQNAARNRAIRESQGDILLFINDDTIATPTMLEEHIIWQQLFPRENIAILGRVTISPEVPLTLFAKLHLDTAYDQWTEKIELDWHAFYTCNVSVKKTFLLKYGLFNENIRYNDDLELAERLSHHGFSIIYNPESLGYHYHYLSEKAYLDLAKLSGKTLAVWYKESPHLKKELASIGLYMTAPFAKRLKYLIGDVLINKATMPLIILLARYFADSREYISLLLYRKIYKALERENIRDEMRRR
jgi:glycosyltransferase involved in cell wall biosynthesis